MYDVWERVAAVCVFEGMVSGMGVMGMELDWGSFILGGFVGFVLCWFLSKLLEKLFDLLKGE